MISSSDLSHVWIQQKLKQNKKIGFMFTHLHALHCFLPFSKCQKPAKTICLIFKFLFTPDLACSRAEIVYFVMSCHWLLSTIRCSHWLLNENLFIPWWLTQEESNCVTRNSIWVNLDFYTSWDLKDRYFLLVKETFSSDLTCSWIAVSSESVKDVSKKFQIQVSHSSKEPQKVLKKYIYVRIRRYYYMSY